MNHYAKLLSAVCSTVLLATAGLRAGEIHQAVDAGNLNKVRALIEADPSLLESKDNGGFTPLHIACFVHPSSPTRQVAVANFLLEKGANVNARTNYGLTPLHLASSGRSPDLDLIQRFIAKGADVNAQVAHGLTSLHWVATSGDFKAAKFLIDNGADLNASQKGGNGTVLHMVINLGRKVDMVKLLVESGARLNQKFSYGNPEVLFQGTFFSVDIAPLRMTPWDIHPDGERFLMIKPPAAVADEKPSEKVIDEETSEESTPEIPAKSSSSQTGLKN